MVNRQSVQQSSLTSITQLFVEGGEIKVFVFRKMIGSDDVASMVFRQELCESKALHASPQHCPVRLVPTGLQ